MVRYVTPFKRLFVRYFFPLIVTSFFCSPHLNEMMKRAAKVINMKAHLVGRDQSKKKVELYAPADIEAHKGTDERYYVLDTARVFPPEPVRTKIHIRYIYMYVRR